MSEVDATRALLAYLRQKSKPLEVLPSTPGELLSVGLRLNPDRGWKASLPIGEHLLICALFNGTLLMPTAILGSCAHCLRLIQFMPAANREKAEKVCAECALRRCRGDA